jgi:predicted MPP superfamily phosphohydrolase
VIRPWRHRSRLDHLLARIEILLYKGGWPFRVARALGLQPEVTTTRYDIPIADGPASLPPLRVGFASDFHAGPTTDPALLHAACDALRDAAPDVLLLGGDFVSVVPSEIDWLARELGRIPAPVGRFAVMGNHDWCSDTPYIIRSLEREGIQVLINRNVRLAEPFGQVWICGLDDHGYGEPDAVGAIANATGVRILLMHAPSGLLDVGQERFDLALCGHTHGGQIAMPGGVPIVTPHGPLSRQYARGRFDLPDHRTLVVSVGLGSVVFPFRLFARPEILLCNVKVG